MLEKGEWTEQAKNSAQRFHRPVTLLRIDTVSAFSLLSDMMILRCSATGFFLLLHAISAEFCVNKLEWSTMNGHVIVNGEHRSYIGCLRKVLDMLQEFHWFLRESFILALKPNTMLLLVLSFRN